ncbi:MAG: nucleotidyltransferase domain-containing protein [Cyanobacteria bacterium P01_D01_bin.156]
MGFPTQLLDARLAREKTQSEADRLRLLASATEWLSANAQTYGITHGYIFGSVTVPGRFTQASDIDIAVDTWDIGNICGLMGYLSLHLNRDVDVVPLDQCHFADKIRSLGMPWSMNDSPDSLKKSKNSGD